jgi:hypothetical protein
MSQALTGVSAPVLAIGETIIRQFDGLYSLNDLHKASGEYPDQRPGKFIRNQQTQALIVEIEDAGIPASKTVRGRGKAQGTYACRELLIAYAAWISAAFHLKVLRVFLEKQAPALPSLVTPRLELPKPALNEQAIGATLAITTEIFCWALKFPDGPAKKDLVEALKTLLGLFSKVCDEIEAARGTQRTPEEMIEMWFEPNGYPFSSEFLYRLAIGCMKNLQVSDWCRKEEKRTGKMVLTFGSPLPPSLGHGNAG